MTAAHSDLEADSFLRAIDQAAIESRFADLTRSADQAGEFPWPIWDAVCRLGVTGINVPEADGGLAASAELTCRIIERLATHSIAASTAVLTFAGFASQLLTALPEQHALTGLLPGISDGSVRGSLSLTEPSGGSDLSGMRTRLRRTGDTWRLTGEKLYTTLAGESTHIVVGALVDGDGSWTQRLALAVVTPDQSGVGISRLPTQALRSCPTYVVHYDDVEVPAESIVAPPVAISVLTGILNHERLAIAAQSCGLAVRALQSAIDQARLREVGGGVLADKQVVRHALVDSWQDLRAARALLVEAAAEVDAGETSGVLPTMAQRCAARAAHATADLAVQLHGGMGLTMECDAQRHWRDTRLHLIGPAAQEVSADYLGRQLFAGPSLLEHGGR